MTRRQRAVAFDITHLVSRLPVSQPSGIDKVDLAYAQHFSQDPGAAAAHYGLLRPRFHDRGVLAPLLTAATGERWAGQDIAGDAAYAAAYVRLTGRAPDRCPPAAVAPQRPSGRLSRRLIRARWRLAPGSSELAAGAIYLNVAQHAFEFPRFFRWLDDRPDVVTVFLVHDLLPLDYPEYFKPGYRARFARRVATVARHAGAVIVTSEEVRARLLRELSARKDMPIHVEPLASPLAPVPTPHTDHDAALAAKPYFIVVGTIEPRKNHLLLLNIWRRLAQEHAAPPQLLIAGGRGWENEQVLDVLDRSALIRPNVIECAGLSDQGLRRLMANARALLMPSFAEGYGLPVIEALSLGTPVIASDIPVFREVAKGAAIFRHPLDGPGWQAAILALAGDARARGHTASAPFQPPTWEGYFAGVDAFLQSL